MKDSYLRAAIISALIGVVSIVAMTIGGELYSPFKQLLKDTFSHHWIGKGVLSFFGFLALGYILSRLSFFQKRGVPGLLTALSWITILATLTLTLFFVYEFFAHI